MALVRKHGQSAFRERAWRSFAPLKGPNNPQLPPDWYSTVDLLKDPRFAPLLDVSQRHLAKQLGGDARAIGDVASRVAHRPARRLRPADRMVVMAMEAPDGSIPSSVRFMAAQFKSLRDGVLGVISVAPESFNVTFDAAALDPFYALVVREKHGDDLAAHAHVLRHFPDLLETTQLTFTNDRHYGPLKSGRLTKLFRRIDRSPSALIGLTETMAGPGDQNCLHYHTSFFTLQNQALSHPGVEYLFLEQVYSANHAQYLRECYSERPSHNVVNRFTLASKFSQLDLPIESLFSLFDLDPYRDPFSLSHVLFERGYPFLRRASFANPRHAAALARIDFSTLTLSYPFNLTAELGRGGRDPAMLTEWPQSSAGAT